MKVIGINKLPTENLSVSEVAAYKKVPSYRSVNSGGRFCNGFLLIEDGECIYEWAGGSARLLPKSLIYLPYGSIHKMRVVSEDFKFLQVDFTLKDGLGEPIILSDSPLVIADVADDLSIEQIKELTKSFSENADNFRCISLLCSLLSRICSEASPQGSAVAPAISYINANLLEDIAPEELSRLCMMSRAKMYRLFKAETGTSPIEYRNRLRIQKAKLLLASNEYSVSEIASMLGFESIYYFSRVFKAHTGVSPLHFGKNT